MANWEQLNFQDRVSPLIEQLTFLHDHIMSILILIITMVSYVILSFFFVKSTNKNQKENHELEIIWTFLPGLVLILIAFPSLRLLYLSEEAQNNPFLLKTTGHQWYWSYEYENIQNAIFDSFIITDLKNENIFRTLSTDTKTVIPTKIPTLVSVSSTDVLHAWTIPSLGLKVDAVPGRLNLIRTTPIKSGIFFGQCSEICGTNHSFIPIQLEIRPLNLFQYWLKTIVFLESY